MQIIKKINEKFEKKSKLFIDHDVNYNKKFALKTFFCDYMHPLGTLKGVIKDVKEKSEQESYK